MRQTGNSANWGCWRPRWSGLDLLRNAEKSQTKIEAAKQVTILARRRERGFLGVKLRLVHFKVDGASYGGRS